MGVRGVMISFVLTIVGTTVLSRSVGISASVGSACHSQLNRRYVGKCVMAHEIMLRLKLADTKTLILAQSLHFKIDLYTI